MQKTDNQRHILAEEEFASDIQVSLFTALEASALTRAELAERMGVTKARVSQMLSAGSNLTVRSVARFASALEMMPIFYIAEPSSRPKISECGREILVGSSVVRTTLEYPANFPTIRMVEER